MLKSLLIYFKVFSRFDQFWTLAEALFPVIRFVWLQRFKVMRQTFQEENIDNIVTLVFF